MSYESDHRDSTEVSEDLDNRQGASETGKQRFGVAGPLLVAVILSIATALYVVRHTQAEWNSAMSGDCVAIEDDTLRLDCYDHARNRPLPQPARGANAPPLHSN